MRLQTQEMSSHAWEKKPSTPIAGKRGTCLQGASALRHQGQGVAQAQLGPWLCLYWFISLSLGLLIWKMGTRIPISRMSLRPVPKENKHGHSVYRGFHQASSMGKVQGALGKSSL